MRVHLDKLYEVVQRLVLGWTGAFKNGDCEIDVPSALLTETCYAVFGVLQASLSLRKNRLVLLSSPEMFAGMRHSLVLPVLVQCFVKATRRICERVSFEGVSGSSVCLFYGCNESGRRLA